MRLLLALAAAVALSSGPAQAAETCEIGRAVYAMAGASTVTLHFETEASGYSMNNLRGVISGAPDGHEPMLFGWGNRGPASAAPGGPVLAFNRDLTAASFPKQAVAEAPYALLFPEMNGGFGIAWTFSRCR